MDSGNGRGSKDGWQAPPSLIESTGPKEPIMSRALLVIDVQNEYFTGALPITHPAGHLEQILKVMDAGAGRGRTVVIQHHSDALPIFRKGTREWELHPEVAGRPRDLLVQ